MPGGKGDYTEWETTYSPETSDRNLTRIAGLLDQTPAGEARERMLAGVRAGLEQGAPVQHAPERLSALIARWWAEQPPTADLMHVAARLGHPDAARKVAAAALEAGGKSDRTQPSGAAGGEPGRSEFLTYCAPCHQTDGSGMARLAAPLRNSTLVLGHEDRLARVVVHGLKGELLMPPMGTLDDQQLAVVLTYVRRAWGHDAPPVSAATIVRVRAASPNRQGPWTREELAALPLPD
jgi:mono/diheme cytochrome c family protein